MHLNDNMRKHSYDKVELGIWFLTIAMGVCYVVVGFFFSNELWVSFGLNPLKSASHFEQMRPKIKVHLKT